MQEEFLYYLWENKLFDHNNFFSTEEEKIEIISTGERNSDSGPDFFNAKIKIGEQLWAGNIEIHVSSSDWEKHHHHVDKAYNNVILHVVTQTDKKYIHQNGVPLVTAKLNFEDIYYQNYKYLLGSQQWVGCQEFIKNINIYKLKNWLNILFVERMKQKTQLLASNLEGNLNSWEETFYQHLAKNFGLHTNVLPFEILTKSLPLKYLAKQKDNLTQIEAMIMGQAGFLQETNEELSKDDYYTELQKEYKFLSHKYELKPIEKHLWKFLRLRPGNFPTIRLAQFAMLIYKSNKLFSKILEINDLDTIKNLFKVQTSEYWNTHYNFGKKSEHKIKQLGDSTIDNILINTILQFLFLYGKHKNNDTLINRCIKFADLLKNEENNITKKWNEIGIIAQNSLESQALIQLKNEYCAKQNCINCQIGKSLIPNLRIIDFN